MKQNGHKYVFIIFIILIGIAFLTFLNRNQHRLGEFQILSYQHELTSREVPDLLTFEECENATHYVVHFYDSKDRLIYQVNTTVNQVIVNALNALPEDEIRVEVIAYDALGNEKKAKNKYTFIYHYKEGVTPVIVYLSPSAQYKNEGVSRAGYTTEGEMMNKVGDVVERILREHNIVLYRANPEDEFDDILDESKEINPDLHLALHSNAIGVGEQETVQGIETWIYDENQKIQPLAQQLQNALMKLYGDSSKDRGVRYSSIEREMRELKPERTSNAILIEMGFHDNYDDALWIVQNIEKIGQTIAHTVLSYFEKE